MKNFSLPLFFLCFLIIPIQPQTCLGTDDQKIRKIPPDIFPAKLESYVNNLVFTGTVKEIPGGTALVTTSNTYILGGGNFSGIVGREVNIIGKVVAEGSFEKIMVSHIQLARQ